MSDLNKRADSILKKHGFTKTGCVRKKPGRKKVIAPADWYYNELLSGNTAPGVR